MFIDDIKKKGDGNNPGPGVYRHEKKFGSQGLSFSCAMKLPHDE